MHLAKPVRSASVSAETYLLLVVRFDKAAHISASGSKVMSFAFVHLSDIHFGQERGGAVFIHDDAKARLIDDIDKVGEALPARERVADGFGEFCLLADQAERGPRIRAETDPLSIDAMVIFGESSSDLTHSILHAIPINRKTTNFCRACLTFSIQRNFLRPSFPKMRGRNWPIGPSRKVGKFSRENGK